MSRLESAEKTLEGIATGFDALQEDAEGPEGTGNAVSDLMDKIKEGLTTLAKFLTAMDKESWWDLITSLNEYLEEALKLIGKLAGSALGLILKLVGKAITYGTKMLEGMAEAAEAFEESNPSVYETSTTLIKRRTRRKNSLRRMR